MTKPKRFGLRLALPSAPPTPHVVPGWPGHYRPDIPTPVGGTGDALTLEDAKQRLKEADAQVKKARAAWDRFEAEKHAIGERPEGPNKFVTPDPVLELVEIDDVPAAEEAAKNAAIEAANGVIALKRSEPEGAEPAQIEDEQAALKGA